MAALFTVCRWGSLRVFGDQDSTRSRILIRGARRRRPLDRLLGHLPCAPTTSFALLGRCRVLRVYLMMVAAGVYQARARH